LRAAFSGGGGEKERRSSMLDRKGMLHCRAATSVACPRPERERRKGLDQGLRFPMERRKKRGGRLHGFSLGARHIFPVPGRKKGAAPRQREGKRPVSAECRIISVLLARRRRRFEDFFTAFRKI